ncbi:MAG: TAT-variant-translocated molybdopterin oxidoreductase [Candidatus Hydrogenedentes bacterium]|nr:TAT-variant-translocated molybdopterin oxidoreductase [Candidatus Hydrogenedentota bacterium]
MNSPVYCEEKNSNGDAAASPEEVREHLRTNGGPAYWRGLDDLLHHDDIDELVHREFPQHANEILDPVSRRNFIKLMGASMMLAGLANCARQPEEKIVPFVKAPEEAIPGKAQYFATAMPFLGYGQGVLATSFEGRPTKLEGLPLHPSSLGATNAMAQAAVLNLYDPDRLDTVLRGSDISTWNRFVAALMDGLIELDARGTGLYMLTQTVTSPAFGWQMRRLRQRYPALQWHQWDPASANNRRTGAQLAFGKMVDTVYDFRNATVILSLDANFMTEGPGQVRYMHDFAEGRDADATQMQMNRLYVVESSPTLTGANADHKINVRYPEIEAIAREVAARLGVAGVQSLGVEAVPAPWLDALVADLQAGGQRALVIAGDQQPAVVHALAHGINEALGSSGENGVVRHIVSSEVEPVDQVQSLRQLVQVMNEGKVRVLVMLEGNPVYDSPADIDFAAALEKVPLRAYLSPYSNETSLLCHWTVPQAHFLESWGDVRAHDGTVSLIQPLILPLYQGRSTYDLMAVLLGEEDPDTHLIIQQAWRESRGEENFDTFWNVALGRGLIENTAGATAAAAFQGQIPPAQAVPARNNLDLLFRLDTNVLDGRFANNGWLQELPRPLTQLTWDNAVLIHPGTAHRLELHHEDVVEIEYNGRTVTAPVLIQFGHPTDAITVHVGYGQRYAGRVAKGVGFNAYSLQTSDSPWFGPGASLKKTGKTYQLADTIEHYKIEQSIKRQGEKAQDRHLFREGTLEDYRANPSFAQAMGHPAPSFENTLYKPADLPYMKADVHAWAMTIDLNRCTGCNACVLACVAENNIAVVGKDQVRRGREMHWIRIDRYYKGDFEGDPQVSMQPVPCMQCENAPCEPVCPVAATSHSNEGLNDMVYNRCIGTRYCLNNCPYKVRRFNFYKYSDHTTPVLKLMRNPNVTVRSRGVMEKCTYCVQRINLARIDAKREGRPIADGEVVTACQAACPARAIAFGDMNDLNSRVWALKKSPRNYGLIEDIGTRPRTTYLAKLRNPSPALAAPETAHANHAEH